MHMGQDVKRIVFKNAQYKELLYIAGIISKNAQYKELLYIAFIYAGLVTALGPAISGNRLYAVSAFQSSRGMGSSLQLTRMIFF